MTSKRKRYSADFKAKVALEALRGELTTAQLATKHGIHPTMVGEWKRQALEGLTAVFADQAVDQETAKSSDAEIERLHAQTGQLVVERDFLATASAQCSSTGGGK
jgi:transposase